MKERVLVIGSGGREHAIVEAIAQCPDVEKVYCYPGNGGISDIAECPDLGGVPVTDVETLRNFAQEELIDLTVVGPEAPLVAGIVDDFMENDLNIFGPTRAASQLEGSKVFAKQFMARHKIPTAEFQVFDSVYRAKRYVSDRDCSLVIKADGLAGGKGVYVCKGKRDGLHALQDLMHDRVYKEAGDRVVIEELLTGRECSYFALTDGMNVLSFHTAVDFKRAYDDNRGPNTGGMGAYSPCQEVAASMDLNEQIFNEIVMPTVNGMIDEDNIYVGFLYFGLMLTEDGPKVLEYNIRLGDPEAQVVLPLLDMDLYHNLMGAVSGDLITERSWWKEEAAVGVVLTSENYPAKDTINAKISGPIGANEQPDGIKVYHGSTVKRDDGFYTTGGRALTVVGTGPNQAHARHIAYEAANKIKFDGMRMRSDIAGPPYR